MDRLRRESTGCWFESLLNNLSRYFAGNNRAHRQSRVMERPRGYQIAKKILSSLNRPGRLAFPVRYLIYCLHVRIR